MIGRARRHLSVVLIALMLAACASKQSQPSPKLSLSRLTPIKLNVETIEVVTRYRAPMTPPYVDHRFPVPPELALQRWAHARLKATGSADTAKFIVIEASVTEEALPTTTGLMGAIKIEPATRYIATAKGDLEIRNSDGRRVGGARTTVSRTRTINEGATAEERDAVWFDLTETLISDFDATMEKAIRQHMSEWMM
jgi:hypothetical protein